MEQQDPKFPKQSWGKKNKVGGIRLPGFYKTMLQGYNNLKTMVLVKKKKKKKKNENTGQWNIE